MSAGESIEFHEHTEDSAPEAARGLLRASARQFGFLPAALARMAESPSVVEAFTAGLRSFDRSSLAPLEREVLVMTLAWEVGCEVCLAIHSAGLQRIGAEPAVVAGLRSRAPLTDPRLEALRGFTVAVLATRGAVDDATLRAFLAAGFTRRHALDVVLGVATYTLSMFANRMTRAPVDPPLEPFRVAPSTAA